MAISKKLLSIKRKSTGENFPLKILHADNAFDRLVGLLGRNALAADEGILIDPCSQVHSFFMAFPIDVIFLSSTKRVLKITTLKPWRISKLVFEARTVLELSAGSCSKLDIREGEELEVTPL